MYYVYILKNSEGILYKGHTNDLRRRLMEHNNPTVRHSFTKCRGPWILIYQETFATRAEAMLRERFLKSGKGRIVVKNILKQAL